MAFLRLQVNELLPQKKNESQLSGSAARRVFKGSYLFQGGVINVGYEGGGRPYSREWPVVLRAPIGAEGEPDFNPTRRPATDEEIMKPEAIRRINHVEQVARMIKLSTMSVLATSVLFVAAPPVLAESLPHQAQSGQQFAK